MINTLTDLYTTAAMALAEANEENKFLQRKHVFELNEVRERSGGGEETNLVSLQCEAILAEASKKISAENDRLRLVYGEKDKMLLEKYSRRV